MWWGILQLYRVMEAQINSLTLLLLVCGGLKYVLNLYFVVKIVVIQLGENNKVDSTPVACT